jgi:hypothetical protein
MLASELIAKLQQLVAEYRDCEILKFMDGSDVGDYGLDENQPVVFKKATNINVKRGRGTLSVPNSIVIQ